MGRYDTLPWVEGSQMCAGQIVNNSTLYTLIAFYAHTNLTCGWVTLVCTYNNYSNMTLPIFFTYS